MNVRMFSKWITCARPNPAARLRLFCLPFAGGGASAYRSWPAALPSWLEVCAIQLPGREERYREPALTNLVALAHTVAHEMTPYLDRPYAIFGHSMGALLAFEATRQLRQASARMPEALFLAGYPAPQLTARKPIHELPDAAFVEEMRRLQGTPEAVLQNADLMAFILPILRADFEACDLHVSAAEPPLPCPFHVYGGEHDQEVGAAALAGWREHTAGTFTQRTLPGTHFFVQTGRDLLLSDIAGHLQTLPL
jgi:medium-chain acyl-[acyl-carrier-protein] hydrolase